MQSKTSDRGVMKPPAVREYLPRSISKAVYRSGLTHPVTVFPVAIGAASGVVGGLFSMPVLYAAAFGGIFTGLASAVVQIFFLYEKNGSRYVAELNRRQRRYEMFVKKMLKKELEQCLKIKGAEVYAAQGREHFTKIDEKYENIREILDLKMDSSELTYGRFSGAAEQVSLSVLDNLQNVVTSLKSAGSIDYDYIKNRLTELNTKQATEENIKQKETLQQRIELREAQIEKVNKLLTRNEEAMTEMEKISAAVSEWKTGDSFSDVDFESAIARLQELAGQAEEYNQL